VRTPGGSAVRTPAGNGAAAAAKGVQQLHPAGAMARQQPPHQQLQLYSAGSATLQCFVTALGRSLESGGLKTRGGSRRLLGTLEPQQRCSSRSLAGGAVLFGAQQAVHACWRCWGCSRQISSGLGSDRGGVQDQQGRQLAASN
jgi:hypothetical protein